MSDSRQSEDRELIARLGRLLKLVDPVPRDVTDFARLAFKWRDIDGELRDIEDGSSE